MIAALLAMLPTMLWADHGGPHYATIKVVKQSGEGTVYASTTSGATSGEASAKWDCSQHSEEDNGTLYIYAKPANSYKFLGWTDNTTSGTPANTGTPSGGTYSRSVSVTATANNPETTYYAHFLRYYNVTLAAPDVAAGFNGYTYSGDGISGTQSSSGGTKVEANAGKDYTFTCNLKNTDVYKVDGWNVGGTILQPTSSTATSTTLKTQFTADATVKVVLSEKEHWEVELAAPELAAGFGGYTVTGPANFNGSGLSQGGTIAKAYEGEQYTFNCAISDESIYEFVEWAITENGVTTKNPSRTLTKTFTTSATVRAILNQKAQYQLTLVKPTGVNSYTVTGASGLSSGGTVTLFGANTCTFDCTLDDNYKFVKWTVTDSSGSHDYTTRPLTQTFASSDVTVTAVVRPKETYELTLAKPEGVVSYAVTGPGGAAVSLSEAGKANIREVDSYTFECTINDVEYTFEKWIVTDSTGNQIQESADRTFSTAFSSVATVKAVLHKKEIYEVTFTKPTGVISYAITGPNGAVAISAEGKAAVYESDSYTISCAYDDDNYELTKWVATDSSGTVQPATSTLTKAFISDATVTVVLTEACIAKCLPVPSGCSYKVKKGGTSTTTTVNTSEVKIRGEQNQTLTVTLSAAAAGSNYQFVGWYRLHSNGVKEYLSYFYNSSVVVSDTTGFVVGAEFQEVKDSVVHIVAPAGGKIDYAVSSGTSGVVDDGDYDLSVAAGKDVTLTATFDNPNESRRAKWYIRDESDAKIYFSIDNPVIRKFASSATLGVDFIPVNTNIVKAIEDALLHEPHEAILASDAEIVQGTSVEIPSGVTIDLNGHTLYVDGALTVNGTLTGGTVSKCLKVIKQTGAEGMVPLNPYGSVKYWKTDKAVASTASVTGWSGTLGTHLTVMRGDGVAVRGAITSNTKFVKCTFDGNVAVNHVTAIGDASDSDSISVNDSYILLAAVTINGPKSTVSSDKNYDRIDCWSKIDCAGWGCTMGNKQISSNSSCTFLNASSFSYNSSYWQGGTARFYNCPSISIKPVKKNPTIHLYDSGSTLLEFSQNSGGQAKCLFYSGKFTTDLSGTGPSWIMAASSGSGTQIYGGGFSKKPDDGWIASTMSSTHAFRQHADGYWYLDVNLDPHVARIGDTKYKTLELALNYLKENNTATITLLKNASLDSPYTLAAGKNLTIELSGCHIDAPNGFIKNYGSLSILEQNNRIAVSGVTVGEGNNVVENYGNGTVDICYGLYEGNFVVNGGTFTTHHGKFVGSYVNNGGEMNLKGGIFSSDVSSLMNAGYHAFSYEGWYYVGRFPKPEEASSSISGFSRKLTAMPQADKTLYLAKKTASMSGCSNVDEWKRVAELKAAYALYADKFCIDILIGFDRDVAEETAQATVKVKGMTKSEDVPHMNAGVMERVFSPRITQTQISYERFIYDNGEGNYDTMEAGISDKNNANIGTVCVLAMDLWKYHDKTNTKKDSYLTIIALPYVFGAGNNVAMIRSATGTATFKSTLQGTIDVVKNNGGGTVMLANNCNEIPSFDTVGTYIVDSMGFEHSFSDTEGGYTVAEGLSVTTEIVDSSVATLTIDDRAVLPGAVAIKYVVTVPPHPADYVVIPSEHLQEWESDNGITGSTVSEIRDALKREDENGIAKWENVVLGQEGTHKPAIETSTNGTETVADMVLSFKVPENTGYTVKYAFDKVDDAGSVVENGEGEPQTNPQLDLPQVTTAGTPAYFKMRAVLESNDHSITTNVPVEHTVGVLKVDSSATYTIIAVPWKSFHDTDVNVAELVHAASLSENDMLYAYDGEGNLKSWYVTNGVWAAATDVSVSGEQQSVGEKVDPAKFCIARGKGAWLKRSNTSKPIYLMGMPTSDAATTTLPAASGEEPSWNLVASPKLEAVDIATGAFKDNTSDEIIVPTAGTPKHYTFKNGAWGYPGATTTEVKTLPNGTKVTVIKTEHKTGDTTVAPGTGFWYLNKGGEKTIKW